MKDAWYWSTNPGDVEPPRPPSSNGRLDDPQSPPKIRPSASKLGLDSFEILRLDWSRTGNSFGRHVDFVDGLPDGIFTWVKRLGKSRSTVEGVKCLDTHLAKKAFDVHMNSETRKEVDILKRLRHQHLIELVGSFTANKKLELLLWPVASLSLKDFLQAVDDTALYLTGPEFDGCHDVDAITNDKLRQDVSCLADLVHTSNGDGDDCRDDSATRQGLGKILAGCMRRIFASLGCLAEAVAYVHGQGVRHKDIKPSNILIYPDAASYQGGEGDPGDVFIKDGIRLTDFDISSDLSQQTISLTKEVAGTMTYMPPEMQTKQGSGRAGDIFCLGCVFFEMMTVATVYPFVEPKLRSKAAAPQYHSLESMNERRPNFLSPYSPFLHDLPTWISLLRGAGFSTTYGELLGVVQSMMAGDPEDRPRAGQLVLRLGILNKLRETQDPEEQYPLFGRCCRPFDIADDDIRLIQSLYQLNAAPETPSQPTLDVAPTPVINGQQPEKPIGVRGQDPVTAIHAPKTQNESHRDKYTILWNRKNQRIDRALVPYDKARFERVKALDLCHYQYLLGVCHRRPACTRNHEYIAGNETMQIFRAIKRRVVCTLGVRCSDAACWSGHNCHNTRAGTLPEDRSKTSTCVFGGPNDMCIFPAEMHDQDLVVDHTTNNRY